VYQEMMEHQVMHNSDCARFATPIKNPAVVWVISEMSYGYFVGFRRGTKGHQELRKVRRKVRNSF